jgi:hypothetical protein
MSIQGVECSVISEKLAIRWMVLAPAHAISICIARNSEFTDTLRHFVIPVVPSILLDTGGGTWYIRLGLWTGTATNGTIEWTAAYGPIVVSSVKPVVPTVPMMLPIIHKQAIQFGMRFFTGLTSPYYVLFETSLQPSFPASATKYSYVMDDRRGHVDCIGLRHDEAFSVRINILSPDSDRLPTDSVQQVCDGKALHGVRCARPLRHVGAMTIKSDNVILHDAKTRPHMRFSSHRDYLRFTAAKAKSGEEITRL